MNKVAIFYDDFSSAQMKAGVHKRHFLILEWLKSFGLKKDHQVLEVGAGVGTVTGLIAGFVTKGNIVANDISEKSLSIAKERLSECSNIKYLVGDISESKVDSKFDVIVLPDVIEHIPKEVHVKLFSSLHEQLKDDGFLMIHLPNPFYLEWVMKHKPHELQVIDQALHLDWLSHVFLESGFYISYMQTYPIWNNAADYQVFKIKKVSCMQDFNQVEPDSYSLASRIVRKIKSYFRISLFKLPERCVG